MANNRAFSAHPGSEAKSPDVDHTLTLLELVVPDMCAFRLRPQVPGRPRVSPLMHTFASQVTELVGNRGGGHR